VSDIEQLLGSKLVIVAHPDDESIGCGILLQRIAAPAVVVCTDGAPSVARMWLSKGYHTREEYARKRASEFHGALAIAGMRRQRVLSGLPDQQLYRYLQQAATYIEQYAGEIRPDSILSHAYEGGHPDHDACAFLAHRVGEKFSIPVWEMPLYHQRHANSPLIYQQFLSTSPDVVSLSASASEISRKESMLSQHTTQTNVISEFDNARELFRPQPRYDFARSPNSALQGFAATSDIAIADFLASVRLASQATG
jgi:LmbE family N-acetylglucosaminyl deacetylase